LKGQRVRFAGRFASTRWFGTRRIFDDTLYVANAPPDRQSSERIRQHT